MSILSREYFFKKMSFVDSLIYSLPIVVACILVVGILTFSKIRFSGDM